MRRTGKARRQTGRARDPQGTRQRLLRSAFQQMYRRGFQNADLNTMLDQAGVTKGALYHHFERKDALGLAVIDEVILEMTHEKWLKPLENDADDPIDTLIGIVQGTSLRPVDVHGGCPLNNLAQELSLIDETFRERLAKIFDAWQTAIAKALSEGVTRGLVRSDVDSREAALFVVALYEGYLSLAKCSQDVSVLQSGIRQLTGYLESLRAPSTHEVPSP